MNQEDPKYLLQTVLNTLSTIATLKEDEEIVADFSEHNLKNIPYDWKGYFFDKDFINKVLNFLNSNDEESTSFEILEKDWNHGKKILVNDTRSNRIYSNKYFDENSRFGINCIFIKCRFESNCKFDLFSTFHNCVFGKKCDFGLSCRFIEYTIFDDGCQFAGDSIFSTSKFGKKCEFGPCYNWGTDIKMLDGIRTKFDDKCIFDEDCMFGERCEFGKDCIIHNTCKFRKE